MVKRAFAWVLAALLGLLFLLGSMSDWRFTAKANLRECQMEALKSFANLRKANEQGVFWPPHQLEGDYISYCMSARGYRLREEPIAGGVLSGERAIHMANPDSWNWDVARLLPKSLRDMVGS